MKFVLFSNQESALCPKAECGRYTIDISYPVFESKGIPFLDRLNSEVQALVDKRCVAFKEAVAYLYDNHDDQYQDFPSEFSTDLSLQRSDDHVLSFALNVNEMQATHNAKVQTSRYYFNWDLRQGKQIRFEDICQLKRPKSEWMAYLEEREAFDFEKTALPHDFLITDDGLFMAFKVESVEESYMTWEELAEWFEVKLP